MKAAVVTSRFGAGSVFRRPRRQIPQMIEGDHMNQPLSLFDDLASADGDAQQSPGGWAAVSVRLDSDGIALTPPLLSEAECREARACSIRKILGKADREARCQGNP
jgi:hypothetical protein